MAVNYSDFTALTQDQHDEFIVSFTERRVKEMSPEEMEEFVYNTIIENLVAKSSMDVLDEVSIYYEDDVIQEMIDEVTA